jgi:hypothetical protein
LAQKQASLMILDEELIWSLLEKDLINLIGGM